MGFIVHLHQEGGCDYTIGCGHRILEIEAQTIDEAVNKLKGIVLGKWLPEYNEYEEGFRGEFELEKVALYEVITTHKIPIKQWYQESEAFKIAQIEKSLEGKEQAEYERLKRKFEG